MDLATNRLLTEAENFRTNRKFMFFARPTVNLKVWEAGFPGPNIPLYKNSYYLIKIKFNNEYPFKPPKVTFKNKVYHPNVYSNGDICLSLFNSDWKASLNISDILNGLQQLLATPNPNSPANTSAANAFKKGITYEKFVRENIIKYHSQLPWD
ncbi:ubiquitin-protein ligase [Pseudoloma neurophilia]|uniref:Ubiquitin-protein ligase n=1 Tax=Pseudoloma neurophilia TaxID=146866 RepID=A0A0R0LSN5_9MICR|nr:ubiquitin-protein ligase [Pseudoloma neurophilia]